MGQVNLQLESLIKALGSLRAVLDARRAKPEDPFLLDACIQRFEYSYELTHKMLKRYLEMTEPSAQTIDEMAFPDLIRLACERGLLDASWDVWRDYRKARNLTSHTYDEEKAKQVFAIIPDFLQEAEFLLAQLKKHI